MSNGGHPWPVCTVKGCAHSIRWASRELRDKAIERHRAEWLTGNGRARCACHGDTDLVISPFPCDQRVR